MKNTAEDLFGTVVEPHSTIIPKGLPVPLARIVAGEDQCPAALKRLVNNLRRAKDNRIKKPKQTDKVCLQYVVPLAPVRRKPEAELSRDDKPGNDIYFEEQDIVGIYKALLAKWFKEFAFPLADGESVTLVSQWDWCAWMLRDTGAFTFRDCLYWSDHALPASANEDRVRNIQAIWGFIPAWLHPILTLPDNEQIPALVVHIKTRQPPVPEINETEREDEGDLAHAL